MKHTFENQILIYMLPKYKSSFKKAYKRTSSVKTGELKLTDFQKEINIYISSMYFSDKKSPFAFSLIEG